MSSITQQLQQLPEVKTIATAATARKLDKKIVDNLASSIVMKLRLDGYEKFVCKCIYWMGQAKTSDIADRAARANKPANFFMAACKQEMVQCLQSQSNTNN